MSIRNKITEFCTIYSEFLIKYLDDEKIKLSKDDEYKINELKKDIITHFFYSPGDLIEFENKEELNSIRNILEIIWDIAIEPDIYPEELENDFMLYHFNEMLDRLKLLKPTLVLKDKATYNKNFSTYYREAMLSWLYGLNNSSIILCSAILEEALEELLCRFSLDYKNERFETLIDHAKTLNVVDDGIHQNLHEIRRIRNQSIHNLVDFTPKTTLELILSTKNIIEKLYTL